MLVPAVRFWFRRFSAFFCRLAARCVVPCCAALPGYWLYHGLAPRQYPAVCMPRGAAWTPTTTFACRLRVAIFSNCLPQFCRFSVPLQRTFGSPARYRLKRSALAVGFAGAPAVTSVWLPGSACRLRCAALPHRFSTTFVAAPPTPLLGLLAGYACKTPRSHCLHDTLVSATRAARLTAVKATHGAAFADHYYGYFHIHSPLPRRLLARCSSTFVPPLCSFTIYFVWFPAPCCGRCTVNMLPCCTLPGFSAQHATCLATLRLRLSSLPSAKPAVPACLRKRYYLPAGDTAVPGLVLGLVSALLPDRFAVVRRAWFACRTFAPAVSAIARTCLCAWPRHGAFLVRSTRSCKTCLRQVPVPALLRFVLRRLFPGLSSDATGLAWVTVWWIAQVCSALPPSPHPCFALPLV